MQPAFALYTRHILLGGGELYVVYTRDRCLEKDVIAAHHTEGLNTATKGVRSTCTNEWTLPTPRASMFRLSHFV